MPKGGIRNRFVNRGEKFKERLIRVFRIVDDGKTHRTGEKAYKARRGTPSKSQGHVAADGLAKGATRRDRANWKQLGPRI